MDRSSDSADDSIDSLGDVHERKAGVICTRAYLKLVEDSRKISIV